MENSVSYVYLSCIERQFVVGELKVNNSQFKAFSINLKAENVSGMTHSFYVRLLETQ